MTQDPGSPSEEPEPPGDPMLDDLERNIEQPPGLDDSLAGQEGPHPDDFGAQLDAVEAAIEGDSPTRAAGAAGSELEPLDDQRDEPPGAEAAESAESEREAGDSAATQDETHRAGPSPAPDAAPRTPSRPIVPTPRRPRDFWKEGGADRLRLSAARRPRTLGRSGRTMGSASRTTRYCPEEHDLVDLGECTSCPKYRHWPEGTSEEPRECWHDWEVRDFLARKDREEDG